MDKRARLAIGSACEAIWREKANDRLYNNQEKNHPEIKEGLDLLKLLKAAGVRRKDRKPWWQVIQDAQDGKEEYEELPTDGLVEEAFFALELRRKFILKYGAFRSLGKPPRPQGERNEVIAHVSMEESQRRGLNLSPSFVKTCWDEFRREELKSRSDLSD
ncbi:MAG: hypothetical protein ACK52I_00400 [Pseudomonadota bacterium]